MRIAKIVSGGQTGVDRAALDFAIAMGIPHGGWAPSRRMAEDGPLDAKYRLQETPSAETSQRTEWNVRDSDATLVISRGLLTGGSALTKQMAEQYGRPNLHIDLETETEDAAMNRIAAWLRPFSSIALNVAGPRASEDPEIYGRASTLLRALLKREP